MEAQYFYQYHCRNGGLYGDVESYIISTLLTTEDEEVKVVPIDKLSVVITLVLAFVFLHEQFTAKSIMGCILIGAGTLLMVI